MRFLASLAFGALWTLWGVEAAIACFAATLALAGAISAVLLLRNPEDGAIRP